MDVRFRPIDQWPGTKTPEHRRRSSPFKVKWPNILADLERELGHLKAESIVILAQFHEYQIRIDGWPKGGASPYGPEVILAFNSSKGPLKFACDTYDHWHGNLRAIGLTLERLRAVSRYGATTHDQQYTGWKALPARTDVAMTIEAAAQFMAGLGGITQWEILHDRAAYADAYRHAAKKYHPDSGGRTEDFQQLQEAKRVLDAHHEGKS